jgi:2-desacetyl-2-hydroxyethyl bacteriochlorophyllide A dehydrogenase
MLEERAAVVPGAGEVLIEPVAVGLCGTDLDILDGRVDPAYIRYPIVIGHEWAGVAADGTRVVVEGVVPCGACGACVAGDTNRCMHYDEFGFTRDGAAADLLVAPQRLVHRVGADVSWESAALVEPAAVVVRAVERAAPRPGARVLVIGDGSVALLAATVARLHEPAEVTMLGARGEQAPLAERAGVDRFTTDAADAGRDYDLVIEAAGAAAASEVALAAPARGGTVLMIGYPGHGVAVPLVVDDLINADVTIMGSFSYTSAAWARVVALLNGGRLDLGFLVTHRFPLERYADAFTALRTPAEMRGKVLLDLR